MGINNQGIKTMTMLPILGNDTENLIYQALTNAGIYDPKTKTANAGSPVIGLGLTPQFPIGLSPVRLALVSSILNQYAILPYTYSNGVLGVGATCTANQNGALLIDGVSTLNGDRILFYDYWNSTQYSGVYVVTNTGSVSTPWIITRAADNNTDALLNVYWVVNITHGTLFANATAMNYYTPGFTTGTSYSYIGIIGLGAVGGGVGSIAMPNSVVLGSYATSSANGTVLGNGVSYSSGMSIGGGSAYGDYSSTLGISSFAWGQFATALGALSSASASYSVTIGGTSVASGINSVAMPFGSKAYSNNQIVDVGIIGDGYIRQGSKVPGYTQTFDANRTPMRSPLISFVESYSSMTSPTPPTLPMTIVAGVNDSLSLNLETGVLNFTVPPGTYTTLESLVSALNAAHCDIGPSGPFYTASNSGSVIVLTTASLTGGAGSSIQSFTIPLGFTISQTFFAVPSYTHTAAMDVIIVARDTATNGATLVSYWECKNILVAPNGTGGMRIVGTPVVTVIQQDAGASSMVVDFSISVNSVICSVTGIAATTIDWFASAVVNEIFV
jgi:hypothetical protein